MRNLNVTACISYRRLDRVISIMARLQQTVRSGIRIPIWGGDFSLLQNLPIVSGNHPLSY